MRCVMDSPIIWSYHSNVRLRLYNIALTKSTLFSFFSCILSVFGFIIASGTLIDACRAYFAEPDVPLEDKSVESAQPPADKYTKSTEANGLPMANYKTEKNGTFSATVNMATVVNDGAMNGDILTDKSDLELPPPPGIF